MSGDMSNWDQQMVLHANQLMSEMHKLFNGKSVFLIYVATLAAQKAIEDNNPGVAEHAREFVQRMDGFERAQ